MLHFVPKKRIMGPVVVLFVNFLYAIFDSKIADAFLKVMFSN